MNDNRKELIDTLVTQIKFHGVEARRMAGRAAKNREQRAYRDSITWEIRENEEWGIVTALLDRLADLALTSDDGLETHS